jgi:hypothetical protein
MKGTVDLPGIQRTTQSGCFAVAIGKRPYREIRGLAACADLTLVSPIKIAKIGTVLDLHPTIHCIEVIQLLARPSACGGNHAQIAL